MVCMIMSNQYKFNFLTIKRKICIIQIGISLFLENSTINYKLIF